MESVGLAPWASICQWGHTHSTQSSQHKATRVRLTRPRASFDAPQPLKQQARNQHAHALPSPWQAHSQGRPKARPHAERNSPVTPRPRPQRSRHRPGLPCPHRCHTIGGHARRLLGALIGLVHEVGGGGGGGVMVRHSARLANRLLHGPTEKEEPEGC